MARLSSQTLFNFTDSFDHFINNLKEGIYCGNNYEKLPKRNNGYSAIFCCFCDIPLSQIKDHFNWYGRFGIGINQSFAREKGVRPVWYVTSESPFILNLIKKNELDKNELENVLPFLKQYLGNQMYKDGRDERKKFYDEREWRYLAKKEETVAHFHRDKAKIDIDSSIISRFELSFDEIEYLIIENKDYIGKTINEIRKLTNNEDQINNLISKIITAKNIEKDF